MTFFGRRRLLDLIDSHLLGIARYFAHISFLPILAVRTVYSCEICSPPSDFPFNILEQHISKIYMHFRPSAVLAIQTTDDYGAKLLVSMK